MEGKKRSRSIDVLLCLALFCAFSACMLTYVAPSLQGVAPTTRYYTTTAFVCQNRLRGQHAGGVAIEQYGDGEALVLSEEIEGTTYKTYIYECCGALREMYTEEGIYIDPAEGSAIAPVKGLGFEIIDGGLLKVTLESLSGRVSPLISPYLTGRGRPGSDKAFAPALKPLSYRAYHRHTLLCAVRRHMHAHIRQSIN